MDVYNGDKGDFQWSQPPQQFGMAGFTMQVATQGHPAPNSRIATLIGVSADGMETVPRACRDQRLCHTSQRPAFSLAQYGF